MKNILKINSSVIRLLVCTAALIIPATGCKKFLDVPLPTDQIAAQGVFDNDVSVAAVATGIFFDMVNNSYVAGGSGIGFCSGLYTDELTSIQTNPLGFTIPFYTDNITDANTAGTWSGLYRQISSCNIAIEGINGSKALIVNKNQYLGEIYATRAWLYFNLVNLYGGVPLALVSDYRITNALFRSTPAQVYAQIIADAKTAASLLPADFRDGTGATTASRARPNKYMAETILARAYLYTKDWTNAEAQATAIINNTALFKLMPPAQTFIVAGNTETIWGLAPTGSGFVLDYNVYNGGMPAVITSPQTILTYDAVACLSDAQRNVFDSGDLRFINWVRATLDKNTNTTYNFSNKNKSSVNGVEANVIARLAEIYLIRAEARAQQNNVPGAQADLNVIRTRAGLPNTPAATQSDLLAATENERRCELFSESGHRFFDLKRTGKIDMVMNVTAPLKGGTWAGFKQLWPISSSDVSLDPNLVQNPGYN
ncbi:RagB/SusD family nutrient uptake outer membrane protein [Jatrophihabitans sp.]|uniref:RagB/SusD family nutrient uptake outer membrane protein n=1 Tax=Jatrophihabitans sp. TaxID=1932789 RepID=UPI0030C68D55|nr:RagB/SusD protein [Jatrophihabitans sp.]